MLPSSSDEDSQEEEENEDNNDNKQNLDVNFNQKRLNRNELF